MAKMSIIFDGFAELAEMVDKSGADLKEAVNEALVESQKIVQQNLTTGAAVYAAKGLKGYATGNMYGTPRMSKDPKVYNAIKGTRTRKAIAKKQEEIMVKHLKLGGA